MADACRNRNRGPSCRRRCPARPAEHLERSGVRQRRAVLGVPVERLIEIDALELRLFFSIQLFCGGLAQVGFRGFVEVDSARRNGGEIRYCLQKVFGERGSDERGNGPSFALKHDERRLSSSRACLLRGPGGVAQIEAQTTEEKERHRFVRPADECSGHRGRCRGSSGTELVPEKSRFEQADLPQYGRLVPVDPFAGDLAFAELHDRHDHRRRLSCRSAARRAGTTPSAGRE